MLMVYATHGKKLGMVHASHRPKKKMTPKKSYSFQHVNFILYESVIPFWDPGIPIE